MPVFGFLIHSSTGSPPAISLWVLNCPSQIAAISLTLKLKWGLVYCVEHSFIASMSLSGLDISYEKRVD